MKSSAETPCGSAGSRSTLGLVVAALLSLLAPALTGCGGEEVVAVRPAQDCSECHSPLRHPGRFSALRHEATFGGERFGCLDCHGDPFDHGGTGFALLGRHRSAGCSACHRGVTDLDGFADAPRSCHGCHSGDDADAPACSVCHPDAPDSFVSYTCYGCHPLGG